MIVAIKFQRLTARFVRVRSLSIVLQNINSVLPRQRLTDQETKELGDIVRGCHNVLEELKETLDDYQQLASSAKSLGGKFRRLLEGLKWDSKVISGFRSRIVSNIILFNTFHGQINK